MREHSSFCSALCAGREDGMRPVRKRPAWRNARRVLLEKTACPPCVAGTAGVSFVPEGLPELFRSGLPWGVARHAVKTGLRRESNAGSGLAVNPAQCQGSWAYSSSLTGSSHSLRVFSPGTSTAIWTNQLSFAAPCQCRTPAGMCTTSPGCSSRAGFPHS